MIGLSKQSCYWPVIIWLSLNTLLSEWIEWMVLDHPLYDTNYLANQKITVQEFNPIKIMSPDRKHRKHRQSDLRWWAFTLPIDRRIRMDWSSNVFRCLIGPEIATDINCTWFPTNMSEYPFRPNSKSKKNNTKFTSNIGIKFPVTVRPLQQTNAYIIRG